MDNNNSASALPAVSASSKDDTHDLTSSHPDSEAQQQMMQSIVDIFQLDEDPIVENEGWEDKEETAEDVEQRNLRTERLRMALPILQQLWWSGSELMPDVADKLANGSRCIKWRRPIGDAGVLNFFMGLLISKEVHQSLRVHVLRLIGNSCADTDENRERVVSQNCIPQLINRLQTTELLPFAIPVLFNICMDYEPAQKQASETHLSTALVELITSPRFLEYRSFLGYVCKILNLLISQPCELDAALEDTPLLLLTMAIDKSVVPDLEDFVALVSTAIAYLQFPRFQESLVNHPSGISTLFAVLTESFDRFGHLGNYNIPIDVEDVEHLSKIRSELTHLLSDISDLPSFKVAHPLASPLNTYLIQLISTAPSTNLAISSPQVVLAACAVLGNVARTEIACETLVHTHSIHRPLTALISSASRAIDSSTPASFLRVDLAFSILGLLKNLAIPASNKHILGEAGLLEPTVLPRFWSLDNSPRIQSTAISLTRLLMTGCLSNVRYLLQPLSPDPDSPASGKSSLHLLLDLHNRSNDATIKMDISRLVAAVCRVLHTNILDPSVTDIELLNSLRQKFYEVPAHHLSLPLDYLLIQNQSTVFPSSTQSAPSNNPKSAIMRSEGWLALAIMAETPEGSQVVAECMHNAYVFGITCEILSGKKWDSGAAFGGEILEDTATGHPGEQGVTSLSPVAESPQEVPSNGNGIDRQRADRSNAFVMVTKLLQHHGEHMASFRKDVFEDLVKAVGKDITSEAEILNSQR